ncbi:glycosyl hydrolase [Edaphobacter aggregans]|uniref:glycosyl hydrolase n=1 Tax=Edaphobacter aggregans TaxID=570835 RepID=UPI00055098EB|nr:glycosyl hydrolase [Edaphobacter aggregans]
MTLKIAAIAAAVLLAGASTTHTSAQTSIATLHQTFLNPPNDAKPMMRWWWFGTAVEKPEILGELQQMNADGIGGVELAFVYPQVIDDPSKGLVNDPFLSPAMLDNVRYAQSEARKLGLRVDVTLGSGWPYGGPATTLEEAATRLRVAEIPIPASATSLPQLKLPEGDSILSIALVNGEPKHWDAATAKTLQPAAPLPPGNAPRTALFFIQSHTRQQVKRAAVGAEGWVLDPFSHQAVTTHLKTVAEPLVNAFGPTPPYAVFSDSLEAYGADWTPNLPAEFLKRRGYDLIPHLPELVAGNTPAAEKIRHDWGKTLTELVDENYLTQINAWATAHHTKFRSQTYGDPAVTLSSQRLAALPEGEGPHWRAFSTLRWASSANHLFGNNVTSAETFTWLHSPVFRATPLDMKAEADLHFLIGTNQIIGHGWPYSPPPSQLQPGDPGWSLYAAAVFNDHNPWHPVMPDVALYIQRVSWLLRQGQPANQVALLLPTDDAWAHFVPGKVSVTGEIAHLITPELMSAILSAGYNVDFIDADTINRIGLRPYQILVLPPTQRIPIKTLQQIQRYMKYGGKVIAVGNLPSTDPEGQASTELTDLPQRIPLVPNAAALEKALAKAGDPDLQLINADDATRESIGFIRRKLPTADIYFVANTSNRTIRITATFDTSHRDGEQWNPETGKALRIHASNLSLNLAPYESRVFVFANYSGAEEPPDSPLNDSASTTALTDLSQNWQLRFAATNKTETQSIPSDWTANPATLHYSGEAIYSRDFNLESPPRTSVYLQIEGGTANNPNPPITHQAEHNSPGVPNPLVTRTGPGMRAWYNPPIREAAIVFINGQRAGSLWHPPYRLDVSRLLKPGPNHIEIRVYNTALNAWSALPPHDYKPLIEKYGDRFQMQDLDQVKPIPAGILGQIHLIQQEPR